MSTDELCAELFGAIAAGVGASHDVDVSAAFGAMQLTVVLEASSPERAFAVQDAVADRLERCAATVRCWIEVRERGQRPAPPPGA